MMEVAAAAAVMQSPRPAISTSDDQSKFSASHLLSEIIVHMKYARFVDQELRTKETWNQLVERNIQMHVEKFPDLEVEIRENYRLVFDKKVLPSMRSLQFGGLAIHVNPTRMYNCSYLPIDNIKAFPEIMFMLLSGCGVGYSVQRHHVERLPAIRKPNFSRNRRFLISDSIEGWSDAVKALVKSYFNGSSNVVFDFRSIRPKGSLLKTSGGLAPGSQILQEALLKIRGVLQGKEEGSRLSSLECHDIVCFVADAVLSGGIRRSALISLFSRDDDEMFTSKAGSEWYQNHPQRCRANNSAVVMRNDVTQEEFKHMWKRIHAIGTGEPGVYLTNDPNWGCNPCCEIALQPFQFCNLVEINVSDVSGPADYLARCRTAAFIATLQASYTDFHYLRSAWKRTTEREALIGVSMTGIASNLVDGPTMNKGANEVIQENKRLCKVIGTNRSHRCTTVKPAGTSSLVLDTSSGIHPWFDHHYLRRVRLDKIDPIYSQLLAIVPELVEDDFIRPHDTGVLSVPIQSSGRNQAIVKCDETCLQFLERIKAVYQDWVEPGHYRGTNTNNVSATVSVHDSETDNMVQWLYDNQDFYNGITIFPHSETESGYVQLPFESIDQAHFDSLTQVIANKSEELYSIFNSHQPSNNQLANDQPSSDKFIDANEYSMNLEAACAGGVCERVM